jgi:hypothetical protein
VKKSKGKVRQHQTPPPSYVSVNCSVKVGMNEIATMPRKNIEAFMNGIAQILAAQEAR